MIFRFTESVFLVILRFGRPLTSQNIKCIFHDNQSCLKNQPRYYEFKVSYIDMLEIAIFLMTYLIDCVFQTK